MIVTTAGTASTFLAHNLVLHSGGRFPLKILTVTFSFYFSSIFTFRSCISPTSRSIISPPPPLPFFFLFLFSPLLLPSFIVSLLNQKPTKTLKSLDGKNGQLPFTVSVGWTMKNTAWWTLRTAQFEVSFAIFSRASDRLREWSRAREILSLNFLKLLNFWFFHGFILRRRDSLCAVAYELCEFFVLEILLLMHNSPLVSRIGHSI